MNILYKLAIINFLVSAWFMCLGLSNSRGPWSSIPNLVCGIILLVIG